MRWIRIHLSALCMLGDRNEKNIIYFDVVGFSSGM